MTMQDFINSLNFNNEMWLLLIPVALMAADILTGLLGSWVNKNFESSKMRSGLVKKFGELIIIGLVEMFFHGAGLPRTIVNGIILYISFMEAMSILENLEKMGLPVDKIFSFLKKDEDKDNE